MALDAFEAPLRKKAARLLQFLRESGLIEKRIFRAPALYRLASVCAPGRVGPHASAGRNSALAEPCARDLEIRLAALRGLGRTEPASRRGNLIWLGEKGS